MSGKRLFISHAHQDAAYCRKLVDALSAGGADVWYDEHNLGHGHLMAEIQRELEARPYFVVILTPSAFASEWVRDECTWAYSLFRRDPSRIILPVTASQYDATSFNGASGWLFFENFKRIEGDRQQPVSAEDAARQVLRAFGLGTTATNSPIATTTTAPASPSPQESNWKGLLESYVDSGNLSEAYDTGNKVIDAGQGNFDWTRILAAFSKSSQEYQRSRSKYLRDRLLSSKTSGTNWKGLLESYVDSGNLSEAYDTGNKVIDAGQGNFDWTRILAAFSKSSQEYQRSRSKYLRDRLLKQR